MYRARRTINRFLSCRRCTQARYCSDDCRARSWHQYHQHECHSLDLLHSVGIAHLALRTVLVADRKGILALRPYLKKDDSVSPSAGSALAGGQHGQYLRAVRLVHHADRLPKRELFMYAATAALLTMFVEQGHDSIEHILALSFGLKNRLRFHFDSETCLNCPFLNIFLV